MSVRIFSEPRYKIAKFRLSDLKVLPDRVSMRHHPAFLHCFPNSTADKSLLNLYKHAAPSPPSRTPSSWSFRWYWTRSRFTRTPSQSPPSHYNRDRLYTTRTSGRLSTTRSCIPTARSCISTTDTVSPTHDVLCTRTTARLLSTTDTDDSTSSIWRTPSRTSPPSSPLLSE